MNPKIKDRLMQDFWGKKWIDLSVIMWVQKQPQQNQQMQWDQCPNCWNEMQWWHNWQMWWEWEWSMWMSIVDTLFAKIKTELDSMEEKDILKLIHMISMWKMEEMNMWGETDQ